MASALEDGFSTGLQPYVQRPQGGERRNVLIKAFQCIKKLKLLACHKLKGGNISLEQRSD